MADCDAIAGWNRIPTQGTYLEIVFPSKLVFTNDALDAQGRSVLKGLTVVTFSAKDGKTLVSLDTHATIMTGADEQILEGMELGWSQSLEKLATLGKVNGK